MTLYATGTAAVADVIRDTDATLAGLPVRSILSTPGYHVPQSETPGSPGWTTHVHGLRKNPTSEEYAYPMSDDPNARDLLAAGVPPGLPLAAVLAAHELGPDWDPPELAAVVSIPIERKP